MGDRNFSLVVGLCRVRPTALQTPALIHPETTLAIAANKVDAPGAGITL